MPTRLSTPVQRFAIGPGIDIPQLQTVFGPCPASEVLAISFQRANLTFVVHIPPRRRVGPNQRVLRNWVAHRADVLVFRAIGVGCGYEDCDVADILLAGRAVDLCVFLPAMTRTY